LHSCGSSDVYPIGSCHSVGVLIQRSNYKIQYPETPHGFVSLLPTAQQLGYTHPWSPLTCDGYNISYSSKIMRSNTYNEVFSLRSWVFNLAIISGQTWSFKILSTGYTYWKKCRSNIQFSYEIVRPW